MNRRVVWIILSVIMFLSGGVLLFYFFWANGYIDPPKTAPTVSYSEFTYPSLPSEITVTSTNSTDIIQPTESTAYVSPVDFEQLKATNPDIVAWLYMTTPYISQPILMNEDDTFYLTHGPTAQYDRNGSLFIENKWNNPNFEDTVSIIYGHRMSDGQMFGNLQASYEDVDLVTDPQYVVIYLKDSSKTYNIIATIPWDPNHILFYNDFSTESGYDEFFDEVFSLSGDGVNLVTDEKPKFGDKILILSTCLRTDRTKRYLVIAKEIT
jgi:sortase B